MVKNLKKISVVLYVCVEAVLYLMLYWITGYHLLSNLENSKSPMQLVIKNRTEIGYISCLLLIFIKSILIWLS